MDANRIQQAAQVVADETVRRNETPADLWGRSLTNALDIPADVYDVASEIVLRALEILEGTQP
jgi:hypothetical protein